MHMPVPIAFKRGNTHSKQSEGRCFTNPKKGQSRRLPWVKTDVLYYLNLRRANKRHAIFAVGQRV
uniref:Uncharacterized protein n=1 Tax=Picea glauca TaxID=3330 RepID=A0A101LU02_PICGL|nr:hypothetical protein ABT39_MTgene3400 [Picea glauca]